MSSVLHPRRSLSGELVAALAGDAALSAATPLRTWEETVVPQVSTRKPTPSTLSQMTPHG